MKVNGFPLRSYLSNREIPNEDLVGFLNLEGDGNYQARRESFFRAQ
jgi:hypothetical protein